MAAPSITTETDLGAERSVYFTLNETCVPATAGFGEQAGSESRFFV
jgi:hypothetical protein